MRIWKLCLALFMLMSPVVGAVACDATIDPGADINTALSGLSSGGTLCLNDGTYIITSVIQLHDGKTIMGHSHDPTKAIIQGNFNDTGAMLLISDGTTGSALNPEKLLWVTVMGGTVNTSSGIVENRPKYGIHVSGTSGTVITTVNISHVRVAIIASAATDLVIDYAYIDYIGDVVNASNGDFSSIAITNGSDDATINHSIITGNRNGHVPLEPNAPDANGVGTMVGDGQISCNNSDGLQIRNTVIKYGGAGMYLLDCKDVTVADDTISWASAWGIDAPAGDDGLYVQNTTIEDSGKGVSDFGAYWFPPRSDGTVQGNWEHATATFYENTYTGNKQIDFSLLPASMLINCDGVNVLLGPDPSGHSDSISNVTSTSNTDAGGTSRCAYTHAFNPNN